MVVPDFVVQSTGASYSGRHFDGRMKESCPRPRRGGQLAQQQGIYTAFSPREEERSGFALGRPDSAADVISVASDWPALSDHSLTALHRGSPFVHSAPRPAVQATLLNIAVSCQYEAGGKGHADDQVEGGICGRARTSAAVTTRSEVERKTSSSDTELEQEDTDVLVICYELIEEDMPQHTVITGVAGQAQWSEMQHDE